MFFPICRRMARTHAALYAAQQARLAAKAKVPSADAGGTKGGGGAAEDFLRRRAAGAAVQATQASSGRRVREEKEEEEGGGSTGDLRQRRAGDGVGAAAVPVAQAPGRRVGLWLGGRWRVGAGTPQLEDYARRQLSVVV